MLGVSGRHEAPDQDLPMPERSRDVRVLQEPSGSHHLSNLPDPVAWFVFIDYLLIYIIWDVTGHMT